MSNYFSPSNLLSNKSHFDRLLHSHSAMVVLESRSGKRGKKSNNKETRNLSLDRTQYEAVEISPMAN